ncbi:hypothetical protein J7E25_17515 [Agromyces sp. ISL-38]|uniref:hypothetical protein n=1 Tax=Agromyces sp. ISL-38 TaxID=2819107 RepID=UPI001BEC39C7|nr:hypothetical protein [Agromyces sp. ISL-38]MBT2500894.1 hypothetical protein [Agromyces sp. ISL-38]MBT2518850.1 hypothetical protein [Streptomyces sp. ISL-90]
MPSVADIERLKALTDRLLPLASRERGEVIAADDWNAVVGALLEVARAVVADASGTAVAPHEHPDQVTLGWLDPRLRAIIERGPLSDPGATARVSAIERRALLIGQQIDDVAGQVRDLRVVTNRHETNDLDRASSLTVLSRTVSGIKDPRNEVATLRASLDAIGTNLSAVSAFAAGLGDVTPSTLFAGLGKVDELEQRLTTPTGALLDAAEFERRLVELATTLVTEDELTAAITSRPARLTAGVKAELLEEAKTAAVRQAEDSATVLTEALRNQLTTRIDEVAQSAVAAAREAAGGFRDELKATITEQLTEVIAQGQAESEDRLGATFATATVTLRDAVDTRVSQLEGSLADRVRTAITDAQPDLLASFTALVDERIGALDDRLGVLQTGIGELRTSLAGTATDLVALKQSTDATIERQVATLRTELAGERNRVDLALAEVRQQIPTGPRGITREELLVELARSNDELRSQLVDTVSDRVKLQLDQRLSGHFELITPLEGGVSPIGVQPGQSIFLRLADRPPG